MEGVNYDGSNSQKCNGTPADQPECPLTRARVGAFSVNQSTTSKMGDYRERLLYSKPPIVGYGSNDFAGVSSTTAVDGSPRWSVDDDAMPLAFFNPETGEFEDSVQARLRSRLMVNFGNPYKEKRADSLIPTKFLKQAPSKERALSDSLSSSPPHDSFDSMEEGEAVFVMKSPSRTSPQREDDSSSELSESRPAKKAKTEKPPPPKGPPPKKAAPPKGPPPKKGVPSKRPSFSSQPAPPKPPPAKPPSELSRPTTPMASIEASRPPPPKSTSIEHQSTQAISPSSDLQTPDTKQAPVRPPPKPQGRPPPPKPPGPKPPEKPEAHGNSEASRNAPLPHASQAETKAAPTLDLQRPDVKPEVDLPAGWMCVWSKSQKRWYFFNTKNNQSVWQWPPPENNFL